MIINLGLNGEKVQNKSRIVKVDIDSGKCIQEVLPNDECRNAVLSNLYCSLGEQGKVRKGINFKCNHTILLQHRTTESGAYGVN